jgi:mycothiol synthase
VTSLDQIAASAEAAEAVDGAAPLDEATWLALRHGRDLRTWVEDGGFALVDGDQLTLVVDPAARGHGLGGRLLARVLAETDTRPLLAWSHADHPAARRLAAERGFSPVRELWVLRRPTSLPLDPLELPPGVHVRGFRDTDTEALLRVNALAFAHHPEQGGMDAENFAARTAEPWWDPAGLLLAVDDEDRLLGFHWTKQHSATEGEVYVVGVDPSEQGSGLGRLVTLAGLHHLAGLGVESVHLYVESDNAPAIRVYRDKLGFTHAPEDTHVMYRLGP